MRCQLSYLSCKSLFLLRVLYGKHIRSPLFRQWRVHFRLDVQPKRAWSDIVSRVSYPPSQIRCRFEGTLTSLRIIPLVLRYAASNGSVWCYNIASQHM